jgi:hypothetical protein
LALVAIGVLSIAGEAQAATPAWKLLALTGPTFLPPKQSEIQRVTIEAEGGTFAFKHVGNGNGTPVAGAGNLSLEENSTVATIVSIESGLAFEPGYRIAPPEAYEETLIVSCSSDCKTPGSTVTLSKPAAATEANAHFDIFTRELSGTTGEFHVGDEIEKSIFQYFPEGTVVTAVGAGTVTLSNPTTYEYIRLEGELAGGVNIISKSAPVDSDAAAGDVQGALEELLGPGTVSVSGGPGGTAEHPYFVDFGGSLAERNVEELDIDTGNLVGQHAAAHVFTTLPGGPGTGQIAIDPANIGGAPTSGEYTAQIGPLPPGVVISGPVFNTEGWVCPDATGESSLTCTSSEAVPRLTPANNINIPIEVETSVTSSSNVQVTISGGSAGAASIPFPLTVARRDAPAGAAAFWAGSFDENGEPEDQAGGHPYSAQTYFMLNTVRSKSGKIVTVGDPKNVVVDLPPGFAGNPLVTPRCPQGQVTESEGSPVCNQAENVVGVFTPSLDNFGEAEQNFAFGFFNDVPPKGYAAEFTTKIAFPLQSPLASVRNTEDFGIRITAPNNPNYAAIFGAFAALEGFPKGGKGKPFFRNPTECSGEPPVVRTKSETWQEQGVFSVSANQVLDPITGCEKLQFQPGFSLQPTSTAGSSGTGATVHIHVDQDGLTNAAKLAPPDLKKAVVKLPEGMSLNPSSADGLEGCSEQQIGYVGPGAMPNPTRFDEAAPTCPDGSKLGTVELKTPLLEGTLGGNIYLATQESNPFHSLIALYLVVESPRDGILLKLPGEVRADPVTGQLTATFDNNPQLPFEDLTLKFRGGGARATLATPEICGVYKTTGSLTPWSEPQSGPPAQIDEPGFAISGNCSSSAAARPFAPSFEAGTTGTGAGAYSPLVVKVNRNDGEQELTSLDFTLPKGLIGKLAGIPYCSDAAISSAESKTGKAEQANPSCPAASRLGSVDTSAGFGSEPFHVGGHIYLAGPYKGAPVSSVVITPALAGPFDLGNVVVRAPLYIDHETAALTAKSDPIPTILRGIPLKLRSVTINVDRPGFILNPTNCTPMTASASIGGGSGATASPTNRFQVGDCEKLKFAPKLALSLKGGTTRNGHPALTAILNQPAGQANIGRVSVALPHSEFLAQEHIKTICTRVQFAANACPKGSIYGHAEAISPLVGYKLSGPVYLRSSDHKLPDLVVALRGPESQPIEIDLDGRIDSFHAGIRNTFELVPDAPVSKFVLRMQGGKKGLLVNSTSLCQEAQKATVRMTGQNGKVHNISPTLKAQCGKRGGKKAKKHHGQKPKGTKSSAGRTMLMRLATW